MIGGLGLQLQLVQTMVRNLIVFGCIVIDVRLFAHIECGSISVHDQYTC